MLRVILPSLQSHQTELYCSNYIFYFLLSSFYLVLLHQILAEWIAIKRPNSSHVIPISLELFITFGFFLEYKAIYQHYQGNGLPFQCSGNGYKILW
jgi:hypothetical protein